MSATILGLARTDRSRPLPDASALPGGLFGDEMPDVVHADDDLMLLSPASRPACYAADGELAVVVLGHVLAVLDPAFADADPADPRTALELYRSHGAEAIRHLDGHVALVVKDGADVTLIQDRNPGVVNIHWLERDGVVAFSDRFAPLLAAYPDVASRLDHGALREYLGRSYVCAPRTAYADVKRLGPGASLRVASGGAVLGQVDDWVRSTDGPTDEAEALAAYRGLLTDALSRWFARDPDALFDFGCTVLNRDYALDGILLPTGRFADHLGIETFSPFLSRPVGDFILSLPWDLRLLDHPDRPGDFVYKRLHRLLSYELLPRDVVDRPKQGGAIDTLIHFQDPEWRDLVRRGLLASPFLMDLCRPEAVAGLFEAVELHAVRIMELVALDLWHRMFVEGEMGVGEMSLSEHFRGRVGS